MTMMTYNRTEIPTLDYDRRVLRAALAAAERKGHPAAHVAATAKAQEIGCPAPPEGVLISMAKRCGIPEDGADAEALDAISNEVDPHKEGYAEAYAGVTWADIDRVMVELPGLADHFAEPAKAIGTQACLGLVRRRKKDGGYFNLYALCDLRDALKLCVKGGGWESTSVLRTRFGVSHVGATSFSTWINNRRTNGDVRHRKIGGRYLHHVGDVKQALYQKFAHAD